MTTSVLHSPNYTRRIFDPESFGKLAAQMVKAAKAICRLNPFTMIAGCGNSGLPLLGVMGLRLKMPILACRKKGDTCCDGRMVNGHFVPGRYLIIDDLISSGTTVTRMRDNILTELGNRHRQESPYRMDKAETWLPECAGILTYDSPWRGPFSFEKFQPHDYTTKKDSWGPIPVAPLGPNTVEQVPTFFLGDYVK